MTIEPLSYHQPRRTVSLGSAPGRYRARPVQGEPAADQLRTALDPLVKVNDAPGAEAQLLTFAPQLSIEARAEAGQRVAFAYYILGLRPRRPPRRRHLAPGRDRRMGRASGAWISGLASWRIGDCESRVARVPAGRHRPPTQRELRPAVYYWAARAEQACRRPRSVEPLLRAAAQRPPESFYGLLARETLGMDTKLPADPFIGSDPPVAHLPNVQRATELARIGEASLAEELLRHQAKIGAPTEHHALIQVAKKLDLPGGAVLAGAQSASPAPVPTPPTATPTRAGLRSTAGGSIRRWPLATSSRNRRSARRRSARPARSA